MRTVREWEDTCRFGHLGSDQSSRANSARAVEYFADTYQNSKEAIYKAGIFLSIYDYIGRHERIFLRQGLMERSGQELVLVEPALLRAVHLAFTGTPQAAPVGPKKVLALAKAIKDLEL